ncbi:MAG: MBL fold metallo-hydrolase [Thermodesulfobacteriota bacterium]
MPLDDLIPLTNRISIVNSPTNGRFPMACSFLVAGTDTRALIDTGCGPEACRAVMEKHGVDLVLNSHCHPDHVSGNHFFRGKELWVPAERAGEVGKVKTLARRLVGPDPLVMKNWEDFVRQGLSMDDYAPTHTFGDRHAFDFGGVSLTALYTPGHLDDHYCFWEPRENLLLTFDVDLTTFGPFYGNPESDIGRFKASMQTIMDLSPAIAASSHQPPVRENVQEALAEFLAKFDRNEQRVAATLDIPRTFGEICARKPIFGKYIPGLEVLYTFFEGWMIRHHLNEMEASGKVACAEGRYRLAPS